MLRGISCELVLSLALTERSLYANLSWWNCEVAHPGPPVKPEEHHREKAQRLYETENRKRGYEALSTGYDMVIMIRNN